MSAQCPQTLPRTWANVGEGRRNLNVSLTCDFTLTRGGVEGECEAGCEPDTALITQRSQVQILPPLQSKTAGQSRVRGSPRARLLRSMSAGCLLTLPRDGAQAGLLAKIGEGWRRSAEGEADDLFAVDPEVNIDKPTKGSGLILSFAMRRSSVRIGRAPAQGDLGRVLSPAWPWFIPLKIRTHSTNPHPDPVTVDQRYFQGTQCTPDACRGLPGSSGRAVRRPWRCGVAAAVGSRRTQPGSTRRERGSALRVARRWWFPCCLHRCWGVGRMPATRCWRRRRGAGAGDELERPSGTRPVCGLRA